MILAMLVAVIGVLLCAGLLLKIIPWYLDSYRMLLRSNCFRGPRAFPFIGNVHLCIGEAGDLFKRFQELSDKYQSPFRIWLGPRVFFVINNAERAKLILTNSNAKGVIPMNDLMKPMLGDGLLTGDVPIWKPRRKIIQPLFHTKVIEPFAQVFAAKASAIAEIMGMEEQGREFDVYEYMSLYSFESLCETTMGISVNAINNQDCTYLDMIESALGTTIRMLQLWLHSDFIFNCTSMGQRYHKCIKYIHNFIQNVFNTAKVEQQEGIKIQPKKSLTSLLLSSTEVIYKFSDKEICDEIATVIAAGYHRTANLLSYTMFILANYPEIQDKVYEEVCEIFGECNSKVLNVTVEDVNRMDYLDRVIKETLRYIIR